MAVFRNYYFFEAFLFYLIIIFGQKACISVGLLSAFGGFLYGAAYLIVGKDYRKAQTKKAGESVPILMII